MNEPGFADAARPLPVLVLRLRMLPYSIGHELLLRQSKNPLLGSLDAFNNLPLVEQCSALILAALICSRSWKEMDAPFKRNRLWGWLIKWGCNWDLEASNFLAYRVMGSTLPRVLPPDKDQDGRVPGGDYLARLLPFVNFNFDCPLGLAHWVYFCHLEANGEGQCRIENEVEREVRELEESILKKRGIPCPA
jgi:hypothetical protein